MPMRSGESRTASLTIPTYCPTIGSGREVATTVGGRAAMV